MILKELTKEKFGYFPEDLSKGSHKKILVQCDSCSSIQERPKYKCKSSETYCKNCKNKKALSISHTKEIYQKRSLSNIEKYGTSCPANNQEIQNKIKENNLKKYGSEYFVSSETGKEKIKKSIFEKYGSDNYFSSEIGIQNIQSIFKEKYGSTSPLSDKDIRNKCSQTMLEKYGKPHYNAYGKAEKELIEELNSFGCNFEPDHTIIAPKHLDGFDKKLNIAIEYCGLYWHTEDSPNSRNKKYHYNKYKKCLDNGIKLITIFEDELKYNKEGVLNLIKANCIPAKNKIFARNCIVKEIDASLAKEFLNKTHIQKSFNTSFLCVGIYLENILIGVMTFSRHHRINDKSIAVLSRMSFLSDYCVVGGASKMLKYSIDILKNQNITKIISWSDNRYSNGNVYKKLGFNLKKELNPDYYYVYLKNPQKRYNKQQFKKKILKCTSNETEKQKANSMGFSRIWDCGKKCWEMILSGR